MKYPVGRHFLQIPGPTNVPDRILRAIDHATIDHRGPEFQQLGSEVLGGIKMIFQTQQPVVIYPSSGTGAWEAALVNTLSPGDRVLMFEAGHFATLWHEMAKRIGLSSELVCSDFRRGVDVGRLEEILNEDPGHEIKAVAVVHNETSTGVATNIPAVRNALDRVGHPALLLVDTISSLASMEYKHDEWGVDVTICGSQKGLMLPPGLGFNVISEKALATSRKSTLPKSYWDWEPMIQANKKGFFPYTPATNLLYGLRESLAMLHEEGMQNVFSRHQRHAEATRGAVKAWGLEVLCLDPRCYSGSLTAVLVPDDIDANRVREITLDHFNLSLGAGLGNLENRVFRIGHLGHFNDVMLAGTLCGIEMGLVRAGVEIKSSGVPVALDCLISTSE